jgi:hypothetical protein
MTILNDRPTAAGVKGVSRTDDIIRSKEAANRAKDRESLPRLRAFREYWLRTRS